MYVAAHICIYTKTHTYILDWRRYVYGARGRTLAFIVQTFFLGETHRGQTLCSLSDRAVDWRNISRVHHKCSPPQPSPRRSALPNFVRHWKRIYKLFFSAICFVTTSQQSSKTQSKLNFPQKINSKETTTNIKISDLHIAPSWYWFDQNNIA